VKKKTLRELFEQPALYKPPKKGDTEICECCEKEFIFDGINWLYCKECRDWAVLEANGE
jgi:hypothetical protein